MPAAPAVPHGNTVPTPTSWDRARGRCQPGCISREQFETDTRCHDNCPADTRGVRCAQHGHKCQHCPRGEDRCRQGYLAGVIPIPGHRHPRAGWTAVLRHPPGRRRPLVPRTRASRTSHPAERHPSRSCTAPRPTPTPTMAAPPSSSSKRTASTRRRTSRPTVPTWPTQAGMTPRSSRGDGSRGGESSAAGPRHHGATRYGGAARS